MLTTQLLNGHGCFRCYLHTIGESRSRNCIYCKNMIDCACHTLFFCRRWKHHAITLIEAMLQSKDTRSRVESCTQGILRAKKRNMDRGHARVDEAPWIRGILFLYWIGLAWDNESNGSESESWMLQEQSGVRQKKLLDTIFFTLRIYVFMLNISEYLCCFCTISLWIFYLFLEYVTVWNLHMSAHVTLPNFLLLLYLQQQESYFKKNKGITHLKIIISSWLQSP